jgi:hypothetical protein
MTCASIAHDLMDAARGVALPAARAAVVDRHVGECPDCRARLEAERALSVGMRRLSEATRLSSTDREAAMLAAFDAAWTGPQRKNGSWLTAAVAALAIAATLALVVVRTRTRQVEQPIRAQPPVASTAAVAGEAAAPATATPPPRVAARPRKPVVNAAAPEPTPFVLWPGSDDLPTLESGHLMRVQLPTSLIVSIGLTPSSRADVVQADVLVDQEGYARAVRLVP